MKRVIAAAAFLLLAACGPKVPATPAPPPPPMTPTKDLAHFKMLNKQSTWSDVKATVGDPDGDVGSGLHIYVYKLADGSSMRVSTPDNVQIFYIDWKHADGTTERLVGTRRDH